ncbi:MAG: DUF423 domain-containing protein [Cyclobacteriaceae bacterium]|nr:DUF423 domain-containing protein [Cyclobacteriaceae bacterium]
MHKFILISGAVLGALAVALGAFGAHALKPMLEASGRLDTFETAVKYQFYHALALIISGILLERFANPLYQYAGASFMAGTLIFSGSLYLICFTGVTKWGAVAPIGGLAMIVGWILLVTAFARM